MSANLMRAGYRVIGYDLLTRRRRNHRQAGGEVARDCRDVATRAAIVICSLPSPEALLQVAAELAVAPPHAHRVRTRGDSSRTHRIVIETSTLPIAAKQQARGTILLDCPLSGTGAQARAKDLVVYASGDRGAYRRVVPALEGSSVERRDHFAQRRNVSCPKPGARSLKPTSSALRSSSGRS